MERGEIGVNVAVPVTSQTDQSLIWVTATGWQSLPGALCSSLSANPAPELGGCF